MTVSNFVKTDRSWVRFTATFASASPTSTPFPYVMGDYALGTVACSGTLPAAAATHLTLVTTDFWGNYQSAAQHDSGFADKCILHPTGNVTFDMPPNWFNTIGSARLAYTNGSGSGILPTAAHVWTVGIKS